MLGSAAVGAQVTPASALRNTAYVLGTVVSGVVTAAAYSTLGFDALMVMWLAYPGSSIERASQVTPPSVLRQNESDVMT